MADNTLQTGTDTIATDDLATLNGGASGAVKVQRVKVGFGTDSDLRDVSDSWGLPVRFPQASASATGNLVMTSTANIVQFGQSVGLNTQPVDFYAVQITGTWTGTIEWQVSGDGGTTYQALSVVRATDGAILANITANGLYLMPTFNTSLFRCKVSVAGTGTATITHTVAAMPVGAKIYPTTTLDPDDSASGTISATDAVVAAHGGAGVLLSGTPTANSYVALALPGADSAFVVQLTGTFGGGTYWFECSADSTNGVNGSWTTLTLRQQGVTGTTLADSATAAGLFRGNASGMAYLRVRATGATTPSVAVTLRASGGDGPTALNSALPTGTNVIGIADVRGTALVTTSGAIAAAGTGTVGPLDVSRQGNVTFTVKNTVAASAFVGNPVIVFEQSDDNTSWSPLPVVNNSNGQVASNGVIVFQPNTASAELMFDAPCEAMNYVRARVTTGPTTNGLTIVIQAGSLPFSPFVVAQLNSTPSLPVGTATGTTAAAQGQVGRVVRATATAAFTTGQTLIAAPGAGLRIYVTAITVSNVGATFTTIRLFQGTSAPAAASVTFTVSNDVYDFPLAANGGGATVNFPEKAPWPLPANTALGCTISAASEWGISVSYYVAP